jgi:hypothetical protein
MPIRPENRARYPRDWPVISLARRRAADWTCQGSPAYPTCRARQGEPHPVTGSKVVLTVGHLDHTPENIDITNLKVWCQRCHLTYDAHHHKMTRQATRRAELQTVELFSGEAASRGTGDS